MSERTVNFDRITKYCRAVAKEYEASDANSAKAAAYRQKVLSMLISFEDEQNCLKALEMYWKTAYYRPLIELRSSTDPNARLCIQVLVAVFSGEIHAQLAKTKRFASMYNLYLGDLHRYNSDGNSESVGTDMSVIYYRRAVETDPDLGQAFNQLALKAEGITAVRYFLLALTSDRPFKAAVNNVMKLVDNLSANDKDEDDNSAVIMDEKHLLADFINNLVFNFSRSSVVHLAEDLLGFFQSSSGIIEDDEVSLFTNTLCISSVIAYKHSPVEGFLGCVTVLCEALMYLIDQVDTKHVSRDDKDMHAAQTARQRRRASSSSDEEKAASDADEEDANIPNIVDLSIEDEQEKDSDELVAWPLAVTAEWLFRICSLLATLNKDKSSAVPAALLSGVEMLAEKLAEKLNSICQLLDLSAEDATEETRWILFGPCNGVGSKGPACCRQIAFWVAQLTVAEDSPLEYVGYFRLRRVAALKKGTLIRQVDEKTNNINSTELKQRDVRSDWLAVYVIFTYDALLDHLPRVRQIIKEKHFIPVVPMFVLTKLDKMKSCGPTVRSALRLIEQSMSRDGMKLVTADSYKVCCEEMADSVNEGRTINAENTVALLVADKETSALEGDMESAKTTSGMTLYKFSDFWKRWNQSS